MSVSLSHAEMKWLVIADIFCSVHACVLIEGRKERLHSLELAIFSLEQDERLSVSKKHARRQYMFPQRVKDYYCSI